MLSSLLRGPKKALKHQRSYLTFGPSNNPRKQAARDEANANADARANNEVYDNDDEEDNDQNEYDFEDEDAAEETDALLPLFSAAHLDSLPVYEVTHSIRTLIMSKCETTLSWEQLRSPQVSQFLVKPIQLEIRSSQFSRATLYALIANSLQFTKEGQNSPGNVGVCKSRAMMSELLAIRLLKEFSTRELIDALSYDFDPLSGGARASTTLTTQNDAQVLRKYPPAARTSTLEVAIKASAKKFLAHPLVVQHLEAIWAGSIVFHSAADNLHRYPSKPLIKYDRHAAGTHDIPAGLSFWSYGTSFDLNRGPPPLPSQTIRRSVTLYDPSNASLFKLSRLRVPRYRQIFSTASYAVMLGLYIAVLVQKSLKITPMEILFWFWGAGFMLNEVVDFTEQGFGLFIMSVWNAFDIGILTLFFAYYILRLCSIVIFDDKTLQRYVSGMAYDVLATTATLLFPRLFSLLDHYRYFSQLLIAFRMMAQDLVAILVLIGISCSGFFVAFTLSFGDDIDPSDVAYALFQILMGFTPAAWDRWHSYNALGKLVMTMFLIICHFLVVTILITVLTNSFMAIVKNANEEHQFLFAINTISMVKSDALFSYIAPSNIIGWFISPLRFILRFRDYVRLNRTFIKITHLPILFLIFTYEKIHLSRYAFVPADMVEQRGREPSRPIVPSIFSPGARLREPSTATWRKDRALEEVFRQPHDGGSTVRRPQRSSDRRKSRVDDWMNLVGEGGASPPAEQPRSVLENLERRRPVLLRSAATQPLYKRTRSRTESLETETEDLVTTSLQRGTKESEDSNLITFEDLEEEAEDGDAEVETNDDNDTGTLRDKDSNKENTPVHARPYADTHRSALEDLIPGSGTSTIRVQLVDSSPINASGSYGARDHNRKSSTQTIVFKPLPTRSSPSGPSPSKPSRVPARRKSVRGPSISFSPHTRRGPQAMPKSQPRPVMSNKAKNQSSPDLHRFFNTIAVDKRRVPSVNTFALDLASDIGDNRHNELPEISGSFHTQMNMATQAMRKQKNKAASEESGMMGRMVLARMNTIEEGFKDILKEVKEWRNAGSAKTSGDEDLTTARRAARKGKKIQRQAMEASSQGMVKTNLPHNELGTSPGPSMEDNKDAGPSKETSSL